MSQQTAHSAGSRLQVPEPPRGNGPAEPAEFPRTGASSTLRTRKHSQLYGSSPLLNSCFMLHDPGFLSLCWVMLSCSHHLDAAASSGFSQALCFLLSPLSSLELLEELCSLLSVPTAAPSSRLSTPPLHRPPMGGVRFLIWDPI